MSSDDALRALASHALSRSVDAPALGALATERLLLSLLDLFGCHLASRAMRANVAIEHAAIGAATPRTPAEARLWGSDGGTSAFHASLANGTIAHHAEFDAGWHGPPGIGVNAAVSVLPAALAVAEATRATGPAFIAACAAGYDVLAALATALCPSAVSHRLHPPGLLGAFGAATAAARLLRLDATAVSRALSVCGGTAPLCPFESFTAGASAKDLYGGWPAAVGIAAASAAGNRTFDDAPFVLPALLGRAPISVEEVGPLLRQPALLDADFKAFPTCRSTHPALSALEAVLSSTPVAAADVESIAIETYGYAVELDLAADSDWPIGARTSIATCVALRLCGTGLEPADFSADRLGDPVLRALAARVTVEAGRFANRQGRGAVVSIELRDGRRLAHEVQSERWSSANPASPGEIVEKFRRLASTALAPADIEALISATLELAQCRDVRELTAMLARAAPPAADSRDTQRVASPACPDARSTVDRAQRRLRDALAGRGVVAHTIERALDATTHAVSDLELAPADGQRALTLALALAPCGAGPLPTGWIQTQGTLMACLARCGFGGPPGVFDGVRGLRWLAGD